MYDKKMEEAARVVMSEHPHKGPFHLPITIHHILSSAVYPMAATGLPSRMPIWPI